MPIAGKDGVHRQSTGFIGFESAGLDRTDVVAAVAATQDRYFQARDGRTRATTEAINLNRKKAARLNRANRFKGR
jgi:hypothetical protein